MVDGKGWERGEVRGEVEGWQKTLVEAADLIDWRGLSKGYLRDDAGRLCAIGAILVASDSRNDFIHSSWHQNDVAMESKCAVERYLGVDRGIAEWNDVPGRTRAEVAATLRAAAKGDRHAL